MEGKKCNLCGRPISANTSTTDDEPDVHSICYHFAYEHDADPDRPCGDVTCPLRQVEIFRSRLLELGEKPDQLLFDYLDRSFERGRPAHE
jgi:hypothetical protein